MIAPPPLMPAIPRSRWTIHLSVGVVSALLATAPALHVVAGDGSPTAQPTQVHFAFSKSLFADVNENDAKAAVKVYAQVLGGEHGVSTGDGPVILAGTNAIAEALQHQQVDLLSVTAEEFIALEGLGLEGPLLVTSVRQSITEEFVLLARADGPIRNVEDLSGRSLIVFDAVRASLARLWLEVLCRERHLGPADQVLARIHARNEANPGGPACILLARRMPASSPATGWEGYGRAESSSPKTTTDRGGIPARGAGHDLLPPRSFRNAPTANS
jgi:hypothetical protein